MKLIRPTTITAAMLVSSTAAEPSGSETAWVSADSYTAGDIRIRATTHRKYLALTTHTGVTTLPENDATNWLDIGPTNRCAMFDSSVGSVTSQAAPLTVVIDTGIADSVVLLDVAGTDVDISMTDGAGGPGVYSQNYPLPDTAEVLNWYDYFFAEIVPTTTLIVTDLPPYSGARLTITINAATTAECGTCVVGKLADLGATLAKPAVSIIDYSRKETDAYGITSVTERSYAKKIDARWYFDTARTDAITRLLAAVRATPVVWIADDQELIESLIAYGFYRDWGIDILYPTHSEASITIEGLT